MLILDRKIPRPEDVNGSPLAGAAALPAGPPSIHRQRYLVARDDTICRMASTVFDRLLRDPSRYRVPELAGQRVRSAELIVQLLGREPVAVVRTSFSVLAFDAAGCLDMGRLRTQQMARLETMLAPVLGSPSRDDKIVEADMRFIAQGGTWMPSNTLARAINDAALGHRKCPRVQVHDRGRVANAAIEPALQVQFEDGLKQPRPTQPHLK
jgi:hypothetical protein